MIDFDAELLAGLLSGGLEEDPAKYDYMKTYAQNIKEMSIKKYKIDIERQAAFTDEWGRDYEIGFVEKKSWIFVWLKSKGKDPKDSSDDKYCEAAIAPKQGFTHFLDIQKKFQRNGEKKVLNAPNQQQ